MRGLPLESGLEHPLVHPDVVAVVVGIGVLAVLPVRAPAAVGALRQVDEALGFTGVVAVVVHADEIPVLVEGELLKVADAGGKHLEVRTVRIGAQHGALIRRRPAPARLVDDVEAHVADFPVHPAVGAERHA